jgi:hypothetical protein
MTDSDERSSRIEGELLFMARQRESSGGTRRPNAGNDNQHRKLTECLLVLLEDCHDVFFRSHVGDHPLRMMRSVAYQLVCHSLQLVTVAACNGERVAPLGQPGRNSATAAARCPSH